MKGRAIIGIAAVFAGLVALSAFMYVHDEARVTQAMPEHQAAAPLPEPVISTTAPQLFQAYDDNGVLADQVFKGRTLIVSGEVRSVSTNQLGKPVVYMQSGELPSVHANDLSADVAATLKKGQQITVQCTGAGAIIGQPQLSRCALM